MSVLAIKPLPSTSQVWKNSWAFFRTASSSGTCPSVSFDSRFSGGSGQALAPFCPWPQLWVPETMVPSGVAIQICGYLIVFSEPAGGEGRGSALWGQAEDKRKQELIKGKHQSEGLSPGCPWSLLSHSQETDAQDLKMLKSSWVLKGSAGASKRTRKGKQTCQMERGSRGDMRCLETIPCPCR